VFVGHCEVVEEVLGLLAQDDERLRGIERGLLADLAELG